LLGLDADSCVVPARATRHAGGALVIQVHAYAPEIEIRSRSDPLGAASVKVAPRGTTSVLVIDPREQMRSRAQALVSGASAAAAAR
jgi:hypothetical protein